MSTSVFLGYANKSHDGFVGHSVLGHWVNLGAGTTTSNLKNTYGEVRLEVAGHRIETGRLNLGTLFGDHAKTAIGTMLSTGTVVSAGRERVRCAGPQVRAALRVGQHRPERMSDEGFLRVAERVLARRKLELTPERASRSSRIVARGTAA